MTAPATLVPAHINSVHDFEIETFDTVGAADNGLWLRHEGKGGSQLRISNTLSKDYHKDDPTVGQLAQVVAAQMGVSVAKVERVAQVCFENRGYR